MKNKDILNFNKNNQSHGYQEIYSGKNGIYNNINKLIFRGNYYNENQIHYIERHWCNETEYYIK